MPNWINIVMRLSELAEKHVTLIYGDNSDDLNMSFTVRGVLHCRESEGEPIPGSYYVRINQGSIIYFNDADVIEVVMDSIRGPLIVLKTW